MMHSDMLLELSQEVLGQSSGMSWDKIVTGLTEEYMANPVAKQAIHKKLSSHGLY